MLYDGEGAATAATMRPLSAKMSEEHRVQLASVYIHAAVHARALGFATDPDSLRYYQLLVSTRWKLFVQTMCVLHLLLGVLEPPSWSLPGLISAGAAACIEIVFVLVHASDVALYCRCFGRRDTLRASWSGARAAIVAVMLLGERVSECAYVPPHALPRCSPPDFVVAFSTGFSVPRLSRWLRPFLLITRWRNVRTLFGGCLRVLPELSVVLFLIAIALLFMGLLGWLMHAL